MERFLFFTNQYLPKPGATGLCVHHVANSLAKQGKRVSVVCYEDGTGPETLGNLQIERIPVPFFLREGPADGRVQKTLRQIGSVGSKLIHVYDYPLRSEKLVRAYCRAAERILADCTHATITASYTPLEAVIAAARLKKKYPDRVKIVYYSTDTLSNEQGNGGILPPDFRRKCGIRWEETLFSIYDRIIIMECHQRHYQSEVYRPYQEKMRIANFPLFTKMERASEQREDDGVLSFAYAGTLYRVLRNPQFLCDCLVELSRQRQIRADFLGGGDCDDILEKARTDSRGMIAFHGMLPHGTALEYLRRADVLLSIGNLDSPMAPSKIYEYMSTGKPIIHIYSWENDPCLAPLRKYGNALLIKEKATDAVEQISGFLEHMRILDYADVEKLFFTSTPEYTAGILESM